MSATPDPSSAPAPAAVPLPTGSVAAVADAVAAGEQLAGQLDAEANTPGEIAAAKAKARQELMDQINALIADDLTHPNDSAKLDAIRKLIST